MNEIRLANFTLLTVMLLTMATFCVSLNTLNKSTSITNNRTGMIIPGYGY